MNEQWEPEVSDGGTIKALLNLLVNERNWRQAFEARRDARDHEGTARLIEYLEKNRGEAINTNELRLAREKHIRECQAALRRDVEDTRKQVEGAVAFGLLRESDRAKYAAEVENVELEIPETLRFFEKREQLQHIRAVINQRRDVEIENIRQRLHTAQIDPEHPSYDRICRALDSGDALTANEYIDMVKAEQIIPEVDEERDAFGDFFPGKARDIDGFMERVKDPKHIIRKVRDRESFCGIDLKRVPGAQTEQAAEMLDAWFTAKKAQTVHEGVARKILTHLGFNPRQITVNKSRRLTWIDVITESIRDKNRCPVPAYGSYADGHYRILCVWERPPEEDLLNDIGETSPGVPVLVFHFGRMTEQRRRDLASLCRERRRAFIVIDDTLILYLCGERGARLPVLFECALPFTFLEPYTITAGLVPPEMFYGRQRERDTVVDPMGSCFIYGGRQLGKTALLRDVERTFHAPQEGRIALWLDLKTQGIGYDRSIDEVWSLLAAEFKRLGVIPASMPSHVSVDKLLEHVETWLTQNNTRRILLLLDEADRFLEYDGKGGRENEERGEFVRVARLKGLMDRTNRRFKVVFAGLHNVQRTTKLENHPLAHYGEPICIGPLLDNGEWREAKALIERPFTSLGYRFESPDLIFRILSQTNYYPNLIQLYCNQLLRHVLNPRIAMFDTKTSPPFKITSRHVEEAYQSQDLRKAIRDRFMWTLQLDPRYEVIAYSIAYGSILNRGEGMVEGFSVSWIQEQALGWWPQGFRGDVSEDSFLALLDEMVGLGVLRVIGEGRYSLRSPNVMLLMGTEEEIERQLLSSREPPLEYEPATFRSTFRGVKNVGPSQRNPLTAQQESGLRSRRNGVSVIFGCEAAGLNELEHFLESAFGEGFFHHCGDTVDVMSFTKQLSDLSTRRKDGTTLVFVPSLCPWNESWIDEAIQKLGKLKSRTSFVRVIFVADSQTAWRLVSQDHTKLDTLTSQGLTIFSLKPWHDAALRQWLDDCGFGPQDQQGRAKIADITGSWPKFLQHFYEHAESDPHRWEPSLKALEDLLKTPDFANEWAHLLGFDRNAPRKVLRDLATWGEEVSTEEFVGLVEGISPEIVYQSLRWGERLSLVSPLGNDRWSVNSVVSRVLKAAGE